MDSIHGLSSIASSTGASVFIPILDRIPSRIPTPPVNGVWENYATTIDLGASKVAIYEDGVQVAAGTFNDHVPLNDWVFGHNQDPGNTNDTLNGQLQDIRIYNRVLSPADIMQLAPEPSSLVLAAFGFVGLLAWGWRRTAPRPLQPGFPALSFAVVIFLPGVSRGDNLLANGDFEVPKVVGPNGDNEFAAGSTAITGWVVTGGTIDIVAGGPTVLGDANTGSQMMEVNGSSAGTIQQTFPTLVGHSYTLALFYSNNPNPAERSQVTRLSYRFRVRVYWWIRF